LLPSVSPAAILWRQECKEEGMATAAEGAAGATPADGAGKKKSSKLMIVLPLALVIAGGAGAYFAGLLPFGAKKDDAEHAEANADKAAESSAAEHGKEKPVVKGAAKTVKGGGALRPLDPFIANLADEGGNRYLKATMQIEFSGQTVPESFDAHLPQIRDLILTLLSSRTFDQIRTPDGKQNLREDVIERINHALEQDAAKAVYFTEFIVQ
jgi:flagellar FliL protein